jgi:hypothetical protein
MAEGDQPDSALKGEAICFTAGTKGAAFGAGVIHAWLASNRPPPLVVAGISAGAFTAAAMQRCYRELAASKHAEEGRWKWFRRYLNKVSTDPPDFLWCAIPDPVDFSADKPPVVDYSCPELKQEEAEARRHYHLLTKLGVWLAGLPVRVNSVASLVVHGVRLKERYGVRI